MLAALILGLRVKLRRTQYEHIIYTCARLNADQTRRRLLEERQDRAPLQLPADNHLTSGINSVNLEDRLGDVETDCRDRLHG
jgi:hypothetical protein